MYVIGELIERLTGQTYGQFVRERIAEPLGLADLWVGLPKSCTDGSPTACTWARRSPTPTTAPLGFPPPPVTEVTEEAIASFNDADVRLAGIPGGGGTMTAADLALFYQALLDGGRALAGRELWKPAMLESAREIRSGDLRDLLFGKPANRALGLIIAGDASSAPIAASATPTRSSRSATAARAVRSPGPIRARASRSATARTATTGTRSGRRRRGVGLSSRAAGCARDDEVTKDEFFRRARTRSHRAARGRARARGDHDLGRPDVRLRARRLRRRRDQGRAARRRGRAPAAAVPARQRSRRSRSCTRP